MNNSLTFTAYIDHFIYRNAETGYGVASLILTDPDNGSIPDELEELLIDGTLTAVGTLRDCDEGDTIEATGVTVTHPVYGTQLRIDRYRVVIPTDALSMERYLASGAVTGIGEKLAHRIVRKFGDDTFRIMEEEPERLAELKGISERMAREFGAQMQEKRQQRELTLFLQEIGLQGRLAARVVERYGDETRAVIRENPYRLAEEIEGIGFQTADEIAGRMGVLPDAEFRVACGMCYALTMGTLDGHSCLPADMLLRRTAELLKLPDGEATADLLDTQMRNLLVERRIVRKEDRVWLQRNYYEEQAIATMLHDLNGFSGKMPVEDADISAVEQALDIRLDDRQRDAVRQSVRGGILILTGGPGTGKTTTLAAILRLLENRKLSYVLAAPTGRAAKRMTEATGCEARTIHRLLEISSRAEDGEQDGISFRRAYFMRNADNPLEADAVVIDEMSMVDMHLFYALLRACKPGMHLILIGDAAQLPSVGPGQVLHDLIASGCFPVVELDRIFRQAARSDIVMNAHRVHAGETLVMDNQSEDFFFLPRDRADVIARHLVLLIRDKLPDYVHAPSEEIQVLVPMRRGPLGAETLNRMLQEALNPPAPDKDELVQGDRLWRTGDKVMQTKNDYNAVWEILGFNGIPIDQGEGIFNGDLGKIIKIDQVSREVVVRFDENRRVRVPFSGMEDMDLAYAMTIHKSQGSEYPAVLLPLLGGPRMLLNRNLLYTAVTRAKSCVVILGSRATVDEMIANVEELKRYTGLQDRLRGAFA